MSIIISEIEERVSDNILDSRTKEIIEIFLIAINDWPNDVETFEAYVSQVEDFLKSTATKATLQVGLRFNGNNAWEGESITELIKVYKFYQETMSLSDIVEDISDRV